MTSPSTPGDLSSSILSWLSAAGAPYTGSAILQRSRKRAQSSETLPPNKRRAKILELDMSGGGPQVSPWYSVQYNWADWNAIRSLDCHDQRPEANKAPKTRLSPIPSHPRTQIVSSYHKPQAPFERCLLRWQVY